MNLQFKLEKMETGDVLILIHPNSKLLRLADNYKPLESSRQDCVERIDFHTLSLKPEVK